MAGKNIHTASNPAKNLRGLVTRDAIVEEMRMVKRVLSLHPSAWRDLAFFLYKYDCRADGVKPKSISAMEKKVDARKYMIVKDGGKTKRVLRDEPVQESLMDIYLRKANNALQRNNNSRGTYIGNHYTEKVIEWAIKYVNRQELKTKRTKERVNTTMSKFLRI